MELQVVEAAQKAAPVLAYNPVETGDMPIPGGTAQARSRALPNAAQFFAAAPRCFESLRYALELLSLRYVCEVTLLHLLTRLLWLCNLLRCTLNLTREIHSVRKLARPITGIHVSNA
eukprot:5995433-Amphidinium_carterae.1